MSSQNHVPATRISDVESVISQLLRLQAENYRQSATEAKSINLSDCSMEQVLRHTKNLATINANIRQLNQVLNIIRSASAEQL